MGMHARRPPTLKPGRRKKPTSSGENAVAGDSLRVPPGSSGATSSSPKKRKRCCCGGRKTVYLLVVVVFAGYFLVLKRFRAQKDSFASGAQQPKLRGAREELKQS